MRNLDELNGAAKSTKSVFAISLIIPLVMGFGAWALADGAAPDLPLRDNYLEMFALLIMAYAVIALPIPYIFRWNWETKFFGAGMISLASGSVMGIYPILCIVQYSTLPLSMRLIFAFVDASLIVWWCSRFVRIYRIIYEDNNLFDYIYAEEDTAVYYLQEADKKVIDKLLKFSQFPKSKWVVLSLLAAFSLVPFASSVSHFFGLPFVHVFLAIGATPLNLMFLGISTKIFLVFYLYPIKIKKETKKPVYVDMSTHPSKCASPRC